jgi:hypothetical protein
MLEYVRKPGAESCRDEEHFRLELAIQRDGRRDDEFLPYDLYDDTSVLVRITLERTPDRKFRGTIEHLPPPGQAAAPNVVEVNSECRDLLRDLAFSATIYLPYLERPACVTVTEAPAAPAPPRSPVPAAVVQPPAEATPPRQAAEEPRCDPDKDGDPANDRRCEDLLAKLAPKYGPRVEFSLLGGGLMTLVYTSDPGPGVVIGASVGGKHWLVALEAQATLPAPVRVAPGLDADVSTFVGLVVPCVRLGETVRFLGCGVVGGGAWLSYDSQNPVKAIAAETIRIGPRVGLEVPFGDRFAFFAAAEVAFAPARRGLRYGPPVVTWEQSVASVFLSAGFSVRLAGEAER